MLYVGINIWNMQNDLVHGSVIGKIVNLVSRSKNFLHSYSSGSIHFKVPSHQQLIASWTPPIAPSIKINFDAAVFNARYFQVGYVARDCIGVRRR